MPKISDFAPAKDYSRVEEGRYPATITKAEIQRNPDGTAIENQWGKTQILFHFELENETDAAGGPIELRRKLSISYGAMAGAYAPLAMLIQAATGIKCGDKAQRNVTTEQLVGARLLVDTENVEKDDKTYTNVTGFKPYKVTRPAATVTNIPEAVRRSQQLADEEPLLDEEIPF